MTFTHTSTITSTAPTSAVWALWSDPATWTDWDPAVRGVALDGAFAEGVTGTMTLPGPMEVPIVLEVVQVGARYLGRLTLGELVIGIDHVVVETASGCEVTVTTTIEGPGADEIGPMVTHDAPLALARLVELAESSPTDS